MAHPLRLCYITDRRSLEPRPLVPRIAGAARAGVDLIQIREKDLGTRELAELVRSAVDAARSTGTRVVVNDRLDVALALGAEGVHLGVQSLPARAVRRSVPVDFLVGVSCHSLQEALDAESSRADYIVLGPIYPTSSKLRYGPPLGVETLATVSRRVKIPVLALGGVTVERVSECLAAGAAGVAGISVFQDCGSVEERVRELRRFFPAE
jgi:thiamine-phosphate pyrophosphorylase